MNNRLISFDLMRCVAIFIILFHHLPSYLYDAYNIAFIERDIDLLHHFYELNRYLGLGLFTFLTGYLLNRKKERFKNPESAFKFLKKKIIRIFPLYYLALIAFIYIYQLFSPLTIAIHLVGLQLLFASPTFQPIITLWFIGLIFIYYCLFIAINYQNLSKFYRILIIILFPLIIGILRMGFKITDFRLILYYGVFMFGIFCAEVNFFEQHLWHKISFLIPILFILVFSINFKVETEYGLTKINLGLSYLLINLLELFFILFIYKISHLIPINHLSRKLIELISYCSYCMFLFHRPLWFVIKNILQQTLEIHNFYLMTALLVILGIPILVVGSYYLQNFYDKYIIKLGDRLN